MHHRVLSPLAGFVILGSSALAGCRAYVQPDVPPPPSVTVSTGWEPLYYRGHIVYYDAGRPIYYAEGRRHYVPRSHRHYDRFVRHHSRRPDAYRAWRDRNPPGRYSQGPRIRDTRRMHRPR